MDFNLGDKVRMKQAKTPRVDVHDDGRMRLIDQREMTVLGYDALVKVTWTAADGVVHEGVYHASQLEAAP